MFIDFRTLQTGWGLLPKNLWSVFETSASGMSAETLRAEVIANNIANANTTRTQEGGPYVRKRVIFAPRQPYIYFENLTEYFTKYIVQEPGRGVRVVAIEEDKESPFRYQYMPNHPDADERGCVKFPNVNVLLEMVDLISAQRAYQANIAVFEASKSMYRAALNTFLR